MAHLAHYREAHPLPMRITHWINLSCMVLLIFSGFLIHFPFWAALTGVARGVHVFCGLVLLFNCIVRYVLAFLVTSAPTGGTRNRVRDYKTWMPQDDNKHQLIPWIKYYLFMKKDHPLSAKLGVPQKISYFAVGILILIMGLHGFFACGYPPLSGPSSQQVPLLLVAHVYAHHPLLHDVRVHLLHVHPHLPGPTLRVSLLRCSCSSIRSMAVWSTIPISTTSSARMTWVTASSTSF